MPWPLPESDDDLLALAKGYPYRPPAGSYLFAEGGARPLAAGTDAPELFRGRVPVVAHGSNRSAEQLARKFPVQDVVEQWTQTRLPDGSPVRP